MKKTEQVKHPVKKDVKTKNSTTKTLNPMMPEGLIKKMPQVLFVMSVIAIVTCAIPFLGLILALVALGILITTAIKATKGQIQIHEKGKFRACIALVVVSVLVGFSTTWSTAMVGSFLSHHDTKIGLSDDDKSSKDDDKTEQVYTDLKQVDVNGMTISEACEKVRAAGWKVDEVVSRNNSSKKSDCSDKEKKVTKASYHTEKYYEYLGSVRSDYESVTLYFATADDTSSTTTSTSASNTSATSTSSSSSTASSTSSGSSSSSSSPTVSQKNALQSAKDYLNFTAFSREGLISQLEYEKYSHADAVYAVDHCGANWNEQAAKSAKQYLELMSFSRDGLIDQLIYEKFTREQAIYGVNAVGL